MTTPQAAAIIATVATKKALLIGQNENPSIEGSSSGHAG